MELGFLSKVTPVLDKIREVIMWVSERIAGALNVNVGNINLILMLILSFWLGKKIFGLFYSTSEGRTDILLIIAAVIFIILKYL